ncbi:MAG: hypothetical protein LPK19_16795, partial [Hymenobacteraceae bacterium]|nr:hypothetical protein [Hymenobacteraceae bacterium]MDX5397911.1 hypothetical protein [Hymenobacteraceae bacterium]MDX5513982.1 hypothetical protein [Hymenobacteraceae bacterium]
MQIRIWLVLFFMLLFGYTANAIPFTADSLQLQSRSARTGIHSYSFLNNLQGKQQVLPRHQLLYQFQNDWIVNTALQKDRFVRENYQLGIRHENAITTNWQWAQQLQHVQNKANQISISSFTEHLRYQHQPDSLAQ